MYIIRALRAYLFCKWPAQHDKEEANISRPRLTPLARVAVEALNEQTKWLEPLIEEWLEDGSDVEDEMQFDTHLFSD